MHLQTLPQKITDSSYSDINWEQENLWNDTAVCVHSLIGDLAVSAI